MKGEVLAGEELEIRVRKSDAEDSYRPWQLTRVVGEKDITINVKQHTDNLARTNRTSRARRAGYAVLDLTLP